MPEHSRDCTIILLDDTHLKVPIRGSLSVEALLDIASSHAGLKKDENRNFFGLYMNQEGWKNWLDLSRNVLDSHHDLPKHPHPLILHYGVRFYVEDYRQIQNAAVLEMYYNQTIKAIMEGNLVSSTDDICSLAACVMQARYGDYSEDSGEEEARKCLKKLEVVPQSVLNEVGQDTCETRIVSIYKNMKGLSRAESIVRYIEIVQSFIGYGLHLFKVRDKREVYYSVGIGREGVSIYHLNNKHHPAEKYPWRQLNNVTYKDRKFWFDIAELPKVSNNSSHVYYSSSTREATVIWQMAKDQHNFFKKRRGQPPIQSASVDEEVMEMLNRNGGGPYRSTTGSVSHLSISLSGRVSPSESTNSMNSVASGHSERSQTSYASNKVPVSAEAHEVARKAQDEMLQALITKRASLTEELERHVRDYKELQAKEMQLTGVRPEGMTEEELQALSQKVQGNQYKFSRDLLDGPPNAVSALEKELELKRTIVDAQKKLLEQTKNKQLRRERKKELREQQEKMFDLQKKLDIFRDGKPYNSKTSKFHLATPTYEIQGGTLPRNTKKKAVPPTSVDDSCLAEMLFDSSRLPVNSKVYTMSHGMLNSRALNKSTGALNEIFTIKGKPSFKPHSATSSSNRLMTSTPQPQRSKARSLLSLTEGGGIPQDGISNLQPDPGSPTSGNSFFFHGHSSDDSSPTASTTFLSGKSQSSSLSSMRTVNLTDDILSVYVSQDTHHLSKQDGRLLQEMTGRQSPRQDGRQTLEGAGRQSPSTSSRHNVNGSSKTRSYIAPSHGDDFDHSMGMIPRTFSYAQATRDYPVSVPGSNTAVPHPQIRPPASTRTSAPYITPGRTPSPQVGRSQSMLQGRTDQQPAGRPRKNYLDPHQETLEIVDPMLNLRGPSSSAAEGTYV